MDPTAPSFFLQPHWPTAPCPSAEVTSDGEAGSCSPEFAFVIVDISPDAKMAFIMDPGSRRNRDPWVQQLHDMQNMQKQFLLALQDPKRFAGASGSESSLGGSELCCSGSGASSPGCASTTSNSTVGSSGQGGGEKAGNLSRGNSGNRLQQRARTEELTGPGEASGSYRPPVGSAMSGIPVRKESCPNSVAHRTVGISV